MSHSFASFATLDEAWGGIGVAQPPPMCMPTQRKSEIVPAPSDMDYSRCGAPLMDDIVNLYTPANTPVCKDLPQPSSPSTSPLLQSPASVSAAPAVQKRIRRLGSGDDYSDSEGDDGDEIQTKTRRRQGARPAYRTSASPPSLNDATAGIELAAYVLSGVMLIFLFESFITLGGNLRAGMSLSY